MHYFQLNFDISSIRTKTEDGLFYPQRAYTQGTLQNIQELSEDEYNSLELPEIPFEELTVQEI